MGTWRHIGEVTTGMATFYLLPPRACLEEALAQLLHRFLPGLPLPEEGWELVVDRLATAAHWPADVFLVPRDDLPEEEPLSEALIAAFGAEPGDQIVEVPLHNGLPRSWTLTAPSALAVQQALQ
ncbi:hypothetical protein [Thermogemmata fonticola]|uniref:Uncharacterized protein n=1 Tax=Thermogemmata fonticola TaxID=2755323 RepID=A0A7V9AAG6_9BACT|nr:hypothetical protein [Thermogemmata fonticola]MBA2224993.1 hypothetical protein [Thermogemmata fonticola]